MKSRLITAILEDPNGSIASKFATHTKAALGVSDKDIALVVKALPDFMLAKSTAERRLLLEKLSKACSADLNVLVGTLNIFEFILASLMQEDLPQNEVDYWGGDLVEAKILSEADKAKFESLVKKVIAEVVPLLQPVSRRQRAQSGVLPAFSGLTFTVETRSVREKPYNRSLNVEEYAPKVVDVAFVASCHLAVDAGQIKDFFFQVSEEDIEVIIDILQAARKDMTALKGYLKL